MPYGEAYHTQLDTYRPADPVDIYLLKEGYTGSVSEMRLASDPIEEQASKADSKEFVPIRPRKGTLNLHPTEQGVVDDVYADDTPWRLRIEVGGEVDVVGPIRKALITASDDRFSSDPFQLKWNDGLGLLQQKDFVKPGGARYKEHRSVVGWILTLLRKTGLSLELAAATEWRAAHMDPALCPLEQMGLDPATYLEDGEPMGAFEVLEDLVGGHGAFLCQERGRWHVYQRSLFRKDSFQRWIYPPTWDDDIGFEDDDPSPAAETYQSYVPVSSDYKDRLKGSERPARQAFGEVKVTYNHGSVETLLPPFWSLSYESLWATPDGQDTEPNSVQRDYSLASGPDEDTPAVQPLYEQWLEGEVVGYDPNLTVEETLTEEYRSPWRYVDAPLRLTFQAHIKQNGDNTDRGLPTYAKVILRGEDGNTYYLRRQLGEAGIDYFYKDAQWTQDAADHVGFIVWPNRGGTEESIDMPSLPAAGEIRVVMRGCIDPHPDSGASTEIYTFQVPTLALSGVESQPSETVVRCRDSTQEDPEPYEIEALHGTGPTGSHLGVLKKNFREPLILPPASPCGGLTVAGGARKSMSELRAQEALYQLAGMREVISRTLTSSRPSLTKAARVSAGRGELYRYLPVHTQTDYKKGHQTIEAVRLRRDDSLSISFVSQSSSGGEGDARGFGSGGGGGSAGGDWPVSGTPTDLFSRSGEKGTITLADVDIFDALGYEPATDVGGTGLTGEAGHKLGIAEDGVGTRELGVLLGDVEFAVSDGREGGTILRDAGDGLEFRTRTDPTQFAKITVSEVEIVTGGVASRYESAIVEIADSLLELNTDAAADAWGGTYVYRGARIDGTGTGLVSKGVAWNPTSDRFGQVDVHAYDDSGPQPNTFQPFARTNVVEEITSDWEFGGEVRHPDWTVGLAHWGITPAGEADFRRIDVDELVAQEFTADVTQSLAGSDVLTKSAADLASSLTVGAQGTTATLHIENVGGTGAQAAFEDGDTVRLRLVDRSGGGLVVLDVWGTVAGYTDVGDGTQEWTLTFQDVPSGAEGKTIYRGSRVLDYGVEGDAIIERTVNRLYSPYDRVVRWYDDDGDGAPDRYEVATQTGQLQGLPDIMTDKAGFYGEVSRLTEDVLIGDLSKTGAYLEYDAGTLRLDGAFHQTGGQAPDEGGLWATQGSLGHYSDTLGGWTSEIRDDGSGQLAGGAISWDAEGRARLQERVVVGGRSFSTASFETPPTEVWHFDGSLVGELNRWAPQGFENASNGAMGEVVGSSWAATYRSDGKHGGAIACDKPTNNLVPYTFDAWSDDGDGGRVPVGGTYRGTKIFRISQDPSATYKMGAIVTTRSPLQNDTTYTVSVWCRAVASTDGSSMAKIHCNVGDGWSYGPFIDVSGGWQRVTFQVVTGSNANDRVRIGAANGSVVEFGPIQVEQKPYSTSIAEGYRSQSGLSYSLGALKEFTLSFLYRSGSDAEDWVGEGSHSLVRIGKGHKSNSIEIWDYQGDSDAFTLIGSGANVTDFTGTQLSKSGGWRRLTIRKRGTSYSFWVDDTKRYEGHLPDQWPSDMDAQIEFMASSWDNASLMYDEMIFWYTDIPDRDIKMLARSSAPVSTSPQSAASISQMFAESYAETEAQNAQSNAESYAEAQAQNAQTSAESYADGLTSTLRGDLDAIFDDALTDGTTLIQGGYLRNAIVDTQVLQADIAMTEDLLANDATVTGTLEMAGGVIQNSGGDYQIDDDGINLYVSSGILAERVSWWEDGFEFAYISGDDGGLDMYTFGDQNNGYAGLQLEARRQSGDAAHAGVGIGIVPTSGFGNSQVDLAVPDGETEANVQIGTSTGGDWMARWLPNEKVRIWDARNSHVTSAEADAWLENKQALTYLMGRTFYMIWKNGNGGIEGPASYNIF